MKVDSDYIDISPPITENMAVFPGDVQYKNTVHLSVEGGDHIGLSSIESTVHIGAHADAPSHYASRDMGIGEVDLEAYMGLVQVVSVSIEAGARILPEHLGEQVVLAKRILFTTNSFPDPTQWNENFNSLSPELINWLNKSGVVLVGIDTPSVDPSNCKTMESHKALLATGMRVLEGLVLTHVVPGLYQLVALPLPLVGVDASPVRAILLPQNADLSQR